MVDPDLVQRGALLFLDPRLSADRTRACATCHPGGDSDRKFYSRGREVEPGTAGARRSRTARGAWQNAPYLWDGSLADLDAVIDRMLEVEMGGASLPLHDRAALHAYVLSLAPLDNGRVLADGAPVEPVTLAARRGSLVFQEAGCPVCHPPPWYFRPLVSEFDGKPLDVPSLRGVSKHVRWGHDGRWKSLEDAVDAMLTARGKTLSVDQKSQLLAYLELL